MNSKYYGWGFPINISTHGADIDRLINAVHIFMALLFAGWFLFFVYVIFRFRQKTGIKSEYHVKHFKTPTYLEAGVAVTEMILLFVFSIPIWHHLKKAFPDDSKALHVRVVAEQFAWNVHYPGKDGIFGKTDPNLMNATNPLGLDSADPAAADDITTINQLYIPVDTPVIVNLSSKDVIHSFSLTVMRVKQDVIPGQLIPIWFQAKATGDFEIACAQLCGLGHYRMRGFFIVQSKEKFSAWLNEQAAQKGAPVA